MHWVRGLTFTQITSGRDSDEADYLDPVKPATNAMIYTAVGFPTGGSGR